MKDKVVLITGSSSGIGKATAIHFSSLGAKLVITGRQEKEVNEVCQMCQKVSPAGYKPIATVADLSSVDAVKKLLKSTIDAYGRLDVLVNNAGYGGFTAIDDPKLMEKYHAMMNMNLSVPLLLISLAVPHLQKTKGNIVNVSSILGMKPFKAWTAYCMSKAALDMMTNCLAIELGPKGIRVNNVNPAYVKSAFFAAMGLSKEQETSFQKTQEETYPLGRVGEPDDVAKAIAFVASDNATWISGALINLDGGSRYL